MALGTRPYRRVSPDRFRATSRRVSPSAALLLAHLCIGRPSHPLGLVELDADYLRLDIRDNSADIDALVRELEGAGAVAVDWPNRIAYIVGWCMDDPSTNPNHKLGRTREAELAPHGTARLACLSEVAGKPFDTLSIPYANPIETRPGPGPGSQPGPGDQTETLSLPSVALAPAAPTAPAGKPTKQAGFKKPTDEELVAFFNDNDAPDSEAEEFLDYYDGNGWKIGGKSPMKDWQATARRWIRKYLANGGTRYVKPSPLFAMPSHPPANVCPVCKRDRPQGEPVDPDWGCRACVGNPNGPDQTATQENDDAA